MRGPQSHMLCVLWVRRRQECTPPWLGRSSGFCSLWVCVSVGGWVKALSLYEWSKNWDNFFSSILHLTITSVTGWDFSRNRNRKYSCLLVLSRTNNWYGFYTHILLPYLDNHHGSYKGVCVSPAIDFECDFQTKKICINQTEQIGLVYAQVSLPWLSVIQQHINQNVTEKMSNPQRSNYHASFVDGLNLPF